MEITPILLFKFYVVVYFEQEKSRKWNCFQNGCQLEIFFPPFISEWWDQGRRGKAALSLGQLRQEQAPLRVCALGRDPLHPPEGVLRVWKSRSPRICLSPSPGQSFSGPFPLWREV